MRGLLTIVLVALGVPVALAASPYAGEEGRAIKSLSEAEIEQYRTGSGMGFAKVAELNHYPGPRHVLDLARELALSSEQVASTQALFDAMKARASELGERYVARERELDRLFASGAVDAPALRELVREIGGIVSEIRYAHLEAHLAQRELLDAHQRMRYDELRGYGTKHRHGDGHGHGHGHGG